MECTSPSPLQFHRHLPEYQPTPLYNRPELAKKLGVGRVLIKDESSRLGLPAFKILGASWAVYRRIERALNSPLERWRTIDELAQCISPLRPLTLITATDGNHGRGVARVARWFGLNAHIWMPAGTVAARIEAIESEGAEVTVVDGDYDTAVAQAAACADDNHWLIQDTSWPGYSETPRWIVDGYSTMFREIDWQIAPQGAKQSSEPITAILVPIGVGSLAAAAVEHYSGHPQRPVMFSVEPQCADCLARSIIAGEPVNVPGPHQSIMVGLNCGSVSADAWPILRDGIDHALVVDDGTARDAIRLLAEHGIDAGESGAASMAGLLHALREPGLYGLGDQSTVLLLVTEGVTDPIGYERILESVGKGA